MGRTFLIDLDSYGRTNAKLLQNCVRDYQIRSHNLLALLFH